MNPAVEEVFKNWRAEKEAMLNPKAPPKHQVITEDDKLWEAPDVAKAADLTKVSMTPPDDKAIRKDVIRSAIAECIHDVVTQDDDGKISYNAPGTVALVDDSACDVPIQSSMGRVVQPAEESQRLLASLIGMKTPSADRCLWTKAPRKGQPRCQDACPMSTFTMGRSTVSCPVTQRASLETRTCASNTGI